MGAHHTLEIELNNKLTLGKDRWDAMHLQQLDDATDVHKTSEVAVLLMEAGTANFHLLTAVLAKDVHRVSVSLPKKRATTTNYDKALVRFFEQVYQGIKDHINLDLVKCVLMAGPGFVKDDFLAWMLQKATQSGHGTENTSTTPRTGSHNGDFAAPCSDMQCSSLTFAEFCRLQSCWDVAELSRHS
ncbi:pelo [Symbiodinium natans]|uniref:Pelo protein n=1 Tax=Symbiodinium natans TaxID=878477 RepID=A0A812RXT3_9DINO|nr:pelo [Symbiodinium natans]